jgi:His/Glu/Gln/Arg/opine family amino acid ABC transporter permease subunit
MEWTAYLSPLSQGIWVTIELTLYSTFFGAILAFAAGIGKVAHNPLLRSIAIGYVGIIRGTPLLVQLFWLYFAMPVLGQAIGVDLRLPPVIAGVMALSLNIGAYGAEVVRGAIEVRLQGSAYEAARALNFTPRKTLWRIALPQVHPRNDALLRQSGRPEHEGHSARFAGLALGSGVPCRAIAQFHAGFDHHLHNGAFDVFRPGPGYHRHHETARSGLSSRWRAGAR